MKTFSKTKTSFSSASPEVSKLVSKALEERLPMAAASGDFEGRGSAGEGGDGAGGPGAGGGYIYIYIFFFFRFVWGLRW